MISHPGGCIQYDTVQPHKAVQTVQLLENLAWKLLNMPVRLRYPISKYGEMNGIANWFKPQTVDFHNNGLRKSGDYLQK